MCARTCTTACVTIQGLLNLGGNSMYTKRIAEHYTDAALCCVWSSAASKMSGQAAFGSTRHLKIRADELVCASQMLQDYGSIRRLTVTSLCSAGVHHFRQFKQAASCACDTEYALAYANSCFGQHSTAPPTSSTTVSLSYVV